MAQTAQDVGLAYDSIIDLLDGITKFSRRLEIYLRHPVSALEGIILEILATCLEIIAIAIQRMKGSRFGSYLKRL